MAKNKQIHSPADEISTLTEGKWEKEWNREKDIILVMKRMEHKLPDIKWTPAASRLNMYRGFKNVYIEKTNAIDIISNAMHANDACVLTKSAGEKKREKRNGSEYSTSSHKQKFSFEKLLWWKNMLFT